MPDSETNSSDDFSSLLFVVAAPLEAEAVAKALGGPALSPDGPSEAVWKPEQIAEIGGKPVYLLETGVGKAAAAAATASSLAGGDLRTVISIGIAGALLDRAEIGQSIAADASVMADEGVAAGDRLIDLAEMGFSPPGLDGVRAPADAGLLGLLGPLCSLVGPVATVSSCSGTEAGALAVAERTGALAEAMEGAAVGSAARALGARFCELRVVSNTTGDRQRQVWRLDEALAGVGELARSAAEAVLGRG